MMFADSFATTAVSTTCPTSANERPGTTSVLPFVFRAELRRGLALAGALLAVGVDDVLLLGRLLRSRRPDGKADQLPTLLVHRRHQLAVLRHRKGIDLRGLVDHDELIAPGLLVALLRRRLQSRFFVRVRLDGVDLALGGSGILEVAPHDSRRCRGSLLFGRRADPF